MAVFSALQAMIIALVNGRTSEKSERTIKIEKKKMVNKSETERLQL